MGRGKIENLADGTYHKQLGSFELNVDKSSSNSITDFVLDVELNYLSRSDYEAHYPASKKSQNLAIRMSLEQMVSLRDTINRKIEMGYVSALKSVETLEKKRHKLFFQVYETLKTDDEKADLFRECS